MALTEYQKKYREGEKFRQYRKEYLERTKVQRKLWAQQYYLRNKEKIIARTTAYRNENPQVRRKQNLNNRLSGNGRRRAKSDRVILKDYYVVSLIIENGNFSASEVKEIRSNRLTLEKYKSQLLIKRIKTIIPKFTDIIICNGCGQKKIKKDFGWYTSRYKDKKYRGKLHTCRKCINKKRKK